MNPSQDKSQKKGSRKKGSPKLRQMLREYLLMNETLSRAKEVQGRSQTTNGQDQKKEPH